MKRTAVALILVLGACGSSQSSLRLRPEISAPPEAWEGVKTVVVFPPDNWTPDIGIEYVAWYRAVIAEVLRERGYEVVPVVRVNRFMLENHFTLAGEVRIYSLEELANEFGVDALFFWDVTGGGGKMNIDVLKADGTRLWGTGEVHLTLIYNAYTRAAYHGMDKRFALALAEVLREFPPRES